MTWGRKETFCMADYAAADRISSCTIFLFFHKRLSATFLFFFCWVATQVVHTPSILSHPSRGTANGGAKGCDQIQPCSIKNQPLFNSLAKRPHLPLCCQRWWSRSPWWLARSLITQEAALFAITGIEEGWCNCYAPNWGIAVSAHPSRLL